MNTAPLILINAVGLTPRLLPLAPRLHQLPQAASARSLPAVAPAGLTERLALRLGPFPFHTFWGPMSGLPCPDWIGRCAGVILEEEKPDLTLVYLPHLDYDPQRFGVEGSDWPRLVRELDNACAPLLDAIRSIGARAWVVSEYGHCTVRRAVEPNRALRRAGLLSVRPGPFG